MKLDFNNTKELREKLDKCSTVELWILFFAALIHFCWLIITNNSTFIATVVGAVVFFNESVSLVRSGNIVLGVLLFIVTISVILNLFKFLMKNKGDNK